MNRTARAAIGLAALVVLALTAAPGRAGDIAGAKATAAGIEWQNKWFKAIAYWHIAEEQAKVGDKQGAPRRLRWSSNRLMA